MLRMIGNPREIICFPGSESGDLWHDMTSRKSHECELKNWMQKNKHSKNKII